MRSTTVTAGLSAALLLTLSSASVIPARRDTGCAAAWSSSGTYTSGQTASEGGVNYVANYWTQGNDPSSNNGGAGTGQPWTSKGSCSGGGSTPPTTTTSAPSGSSPTPSPSSAPPPPPSTGSVVFSPYKDVTVNANWNTGVMSTKVTGSLQAVTDAAPSLPALTWAFATGECGAENWGGIAASAMASANVQAFASAGIKYILSTGGAAGSFTCGSDDGSSKFIDTYASDSLIGVDFDIEAGQSSADIDALVSRVKAAQANPKYKNLRFSFTIATLGGNTQQSLGTMGQTVMTSIQNGGLSDYYINLMTMDYGGVSATNCVVSGSACDMGASAIQAAENLHKQYNLPYSQIELTPMIGGNDGPDYVDNTFTIDNAKSVASYVKSNGLAGLHYWSFDRDTDCAPSTSSPSCNTYGQGGNLGFMNAFIGSL